MRPHARCLRRLCLSKSTGPACNGEENFRSALIDAFPSERASIEKYFRGLKSAMAWISRHFMAMAVPAPLSWMVRLVNRLTANLPLSVTQQYLKRRFRYSQLRTVVTSQWAGYGMPPGASAFATHAVIATHYLSGAWYPNGGASEIAKAAGAVIRGAGGALLSNHEVRSILLEGNRAVGVEAFAKKGKSGAQVEFRAPVIVSDAGAWNTFMRCCPVLPCHSETSSNRRPRDSRLSSFFSACGAPPVRWVSKERITGFFHFLTMMKCTLDGTSCSAHGRNYRSTFLPNFGGVSRRTLASTGHRQ